MVSKYFDWNAAAPLSAAARAAMTAWIQEEGVGNPSSIHRVGRRSKRLLSEARDAVAASLGARVDPEKVLLSSSGTESNQWAIRSALQKGLNGQAPRRWVTTSVEHDSIRSLIPWAKAEGIEVVELPVNSNGEVDVEVFSRELGAEAKPLGLLSFIWVNNETGIISPAEQWVSAVRAAHPNALIHIDGAQAWGKLNFDLLKIRPDYATFSGHKIGAPAGTGVLVVGDRVPLESIFPGKQEKGRRGGTENLVGLIGLGAAASSLNPRDLEDMLTPLRKELESEIERRIEGVRVNGKNASRVANTLNLSFEGVEGDGLVMALDLEGVAVSAGSACSSGVLDPSHVLLAMGIPPGLATASIRISMSVDHTREDIYDLVNILERVVSRVRKAKRPSERG